MGGVAPRETGDPLIVLLYLLLRDHVHPGEMEQAVLNVEKGLPSLLCNPYLAEYADNIAKRLLILELEPEAEKS